MYLNLGLTVPNMIYTVVRQCPKPYSSNYGPKLTARLPCDLGLEKEVRSAPPILPGYLRLPHWVRFRGYFSQKIRTPLPPNPNEFKATVKLHVTIRVPLRVSYHLL